MRIIIINGPNLNMLGIRERELYGAASYQDLVDYIQNYCDSNRIDVDFYQSNHEGNLVDQIQACYGKYDGIVINPGGYTMTSVALLDAVKAVGIPTVEVHITEMDKREDFRQRSYIGMACLKIISGKGFAGYTEAIDVLQMSLTDRQPVL